MRNLAAVLVLVAIVGSVRAEELRLKDGRVLEGRVVSRADGQVVFRTRTGEVRLDESAVEAIVAKRCIFDDYAERSAALKPGDVCGRLELARWCEEQKLLPEMRDEVSKVLSVDADNVAARELLGQMKVGGKWLPKDQAMKALGWVRKDGRWLTPEEGRRIERAEAEKRRIRRLESTVNTLIADMFDGDERGAELAYDKLIGLAKQERVSGLEDIARRLRKSARAVRHARASGDVTLEVRLQNAELRQLRTMPVSLGTGAPVSLELPEVRATRVNTTVTVPVR